MAATAVTVRQLLRNDDVTGTASCSMTAMSTANTYYIPFGGAGEIGFRINYNACEASTAYCIGIVVSSGDGGAAGPASSVFQIWTTSCGNHDWYYGPFDSMRFGNLSTSTSYGEELNGNYLIVYHYQTSSSACTATSDAATAAPGEVHIEAFRWPQVAFST
jgi:hypothetical protein